jgi:hypothetical protein
MATFDSSHNYTIVSMKEFHHRFLLDFNEAHTFKNINYILKKGTIYSELK